MTVRVIPRLDIKGPNLVKGIHLEGLRVLGRPQDFARLYYEQGADELLYMDVVASLYERNSLLGMISQIAKNVFIPITVGGGLRTTEDIRDALRAGADKVALNTAAIDRPELISEAATQFGSSSIVVSIEAIRKPNGCYEAYTDNGRETTGVDALEWAGRVADSGAGEIMVTSIDREGTGKGFDIELTRRIAETVSIPVIACGGAGRPDHVRDLFLQTGTSAVCLASMLHYSVLRRHESKGHPSSERNTEYLMSQGTFSKVSDVSLEELKDSLIESGIGCRTAGFQQISSHPDPDRLL